MFYARARHGGFGPSATWQRFRLMKRLAEGKE
jgi:hypothetical protein